MSEDREQTLGEFLRTERQRRGLTIEQTASATKIGLKILRHLEADEYADLPALPFVRGFVRNYGKFLGLDGEKLLAEYGPFLEERANARPKRDAGHSGYAFERPDGEQSRKILWGVMAGMLVFGGAVVFLFKPALKKKHHGPVDKMKPTPTEVALLIASPVPSGQPSDGPSPEPAPTVTVTPIPSETPFVAPKIPLVLAPSPVVTPSPTAPSPVATPSPETVPSPTAVPAPIAAPSPVTVPSPAAEVPSPTPGSSPSPFVPGDDLKADPLQSGLNYEVPEIKFRLVFRAEGDGWVRYRCDDKKVMKFVLKKGRSLVLRGKNVIRFQTSNPDSITIRSPSQGEIPVSQSNYAFEHLGNTSIVIPVQARDTLKETFSGFSPLQSLETAAPAAPSDSVE